MSKMIKCDQCGKLMYTDSREENKVKERNTWRTNSNSHSG